MTTLPVTFDLDELEALANAATPELRGPEHWEDLSNWEEFVQAVSDPGLILTLIARLRAAEADVERRVRDAVAAHVRQGDTAAGRWEG